MAGVGWLFGFLLDGFGFALLCGFVEEGGHHGVHVGDGLFFFIHLAACDELGGDEGGNS
jgi:hypothetical protein